jgi:hypothetical protein
MSRAYLILDPSRGLSVENMIVRSVRNLNTAKVMCRLSSGHRIIAAIEPKQFGKHRVRYRILWDGSRWVKNPPFRELIEASDKTDWRTYE